MVLLPQNINLSLSDQEIKNLLLKDGYRIFKINQIENYQKGIFQTTDIKIAFNNYLKSKLTTIVKVSGNQGAQGYQGVQGNQGYQGSEGGDILLASTYNKDATGGILLGSQYNP